MPLQRETVVRAALHLLDEVGLDGLTVRRLATYLDIQNPTLYWHFTNKQELLNCMAELMISDAFAELQPLGPDQDWADWLDNLPAFCAACRLLIAMEREHWRKRNFRSAISSSALSWLLTCFRMPALRDARPPPE